MPSKMKIMHIIAGAPQGGAETFCLDAIKALNEHSVQSCQRHAFPIAQFVIGRPHNHFTKELAAHRIPFTPLTFNRLRKIHEQKIITHTINEFKPDIVHCWMNRAASFLPSNISVPTLGWFGGYYKLKNYKNCDFYMGVTYDIVRHIIKKTNKPHRVYLGHTMGTLEKSPELSPSDFDIPHNAKIVLLLSRMHWKKGIDTLLKAACKLPDVYFLLAGDGPDLKKYKQLAHKLGLDDRVKFIGWRTDRAALLKLADICVLPSRYEPFGTVIAEAWHAQTPLVATKAAGALQYVTHNIDGLLCDIDDDFQLAQHIRTLLLDESTGKYLTANGYKRYQKLFSKEAVSNTLIKSYQGIQRIGKNKPLIVPFDDEVCPPSLTNHLHENFKIRLSPHTQKVAAIYSRHYDDASLALDAAFIQQTGQYNFVRKGMKGYLIEILTEEEINTILKNHHNITQNDPSDE